MEILYTFIGLLVIVGIYFLTKTVKKKKAQFNKIYQIRDTAFESLAFESKIFNLQNIHREKIKINPLKIDYKTDELAAGRVVGMIESGEFSHAKMGEASKDLIMLGADTVGENLSFGYGSPKSIIAALLRSPGHKKNMLNPNYDWCGISVMKNLQNRIIVCILYGGDDEI